MNRPNLETLVDQTLSNDRSPLTRGSELNSLLKEFIDTLFTYKQVYVKTCTNVTSVTVPSSEHLLPSVTGIRCEDSNGNEILIPNNINRTNLTVTVTPSTTLTFKLIIF